MQSTALVLLQFLNHLEHESGRGCEHSTRATSDLGGSTGELRWCSRVGRCGSDGSATGRLDGHGRVVCTSSRGSGKAGAVGRNRSTTLHGEVGASDAGLVGQVEHEGEVAEEGVAVWAGGRVGVNVSVLELVLCLHYGKLNTGTYSAENSADEKLPCFPLKSPVWQVSGLLASQGGVSPRL
jgi:hypothetical protein